MTFFALFLLSAIIAIMWLDYSLNKMLSKNSKQQSHSSLWYLIVESVKQK